MTNLRESILGHGLAALKRKLGPLWWHGGLMFGVLRIGEVVNLYISVFLVPSVISGEELGAVLPLMQLSVFVGRPFMVFLQTMLKFLGVFDAAGERGKVKKLLYDVTFLTTGFTVAVILFLYLGRGFVQERLKIDTPWIIYFVGGLGVVISWQRIVTAAVRGLQKFNWLIFQHIVEPSLRLVLVLFLLRRFQIMGLVSSSFLSIFVVVVIVALWGLRDYLGHRVVPVSYAEHYKEMRQYFLPTGIMLIAGVIQLMGEPWIIRQRLPTEESAAYYLVAIFGTVPAYASGAIMPFFFPLVSAKHERGESTRALHLQALAVSLVASLLVAVALGFSGRFIMNSRAAWRTYVDYAYLIGPVAFMSTLQSVINLHMTHEAACRRFRFLWTYAPIAVLEIVVLYGLMGWYFFRGCVPEVVWCTVESFVCRELWYIIVFMVAARVVLAGCLLLGYWRNEGKSQA